MSLFSDNIRSLREKKKISQEKLAESLGITRERYVKYEYGTSEAPYEILKNISKYYHVSIDLLLTVDLRRYPIEEVLKLEDNRIVLPVVVDNEGENCIEIVAHKAKAGYLLNYSDPEYIENLDRISLPFLSKENKYRAFPIEGDSMPPYQDGTFIIGRYIERWDEIKNDKTYIVITTEGMVYKRIKKLEGWLLELISDESYYSPYQIGFSDVLEIWEFTASIATKEFDPNYMNGNNIQMVLDTIRKDIVEIKGKL